MAINNTVPEITYAITSASTGPFPIPFEFEDNADLLVYLYATGSVPVDANLLVLNDDYSVTGEDDDAAAL